MLAAMWCWRQWAVLAAAMGGAGGGGSSHSIAADLAGRAAGSAVVARVFHTITISYVWHQGCNILARRHKEIVMNIKAIIASLVLGSSSVAMAAPGVTFAANAQGSYGTTADCDQHGDPVGTVKSPPIYRPDTTVKSPPIYRPDTTVKSPPIYRPDMTVESPPIMRPGWKLPPVYRPVMLASDVSFARDGRTFITVGSQAGRFETLTINAAGGRTFIKQVYVQFDNGQAQVVRNLDRTLAGNESLTVDLGGNRRAIRRIVVYGNDIAGRHQSAGTFTVTAS
jgi:hypothetical protein